MFKKAFEVRNRQCTNISLIHIDELSLLGQLNLNFVNCPPWLWVNNMHICFFFFPEMLVISCSTVVYAGPLELSPPFTPLATALGICIVGPFTAIEWLKYRGSVVCATVIRLWILIRFYFLTGSICLCGEKERSGPEMPDWVHGGETGRPHQCPPCMYWA